MTNLAANLSLVVFGTSVWAVNLSPQGTGIGSAQFQRQNGSEFFSACGGGSTTQNTSSSSTSLGKVYMLGDSITLGAQEAGIADKFKEAGASDATISASGGGNLGSPGTTGTRKSGFEAIEGDKDIIKAASTIIIAHGTNQMSNDVGSPSDSEAYVTNSRASIKEAIEKVKATGTSGKIYWVDVAISSAGPGIYPSFVHLINKAIYESASQEGYTTISWAKKVDTSYDPANATGPVNDSKGYLADGVHPSSEGQPIYMDTVVEGAKNGGGGATPASQDSGCCATGAATVTGGGEGCGSPTDSEANKKQIWEWLHGKGLSDVAAAGIMGNMMQESGFIPKATNPIGCRGVVQWCFGRNDKLDEFAASKGKPWDCLEVQLEYMWSEMEEESVISRSDGTRLPDGVKLYNVMNGQDFDKKSEYTGTGPGKVAKIFHDYFERANTATGEDIGRDTKANEVYEELTGKEPPSDIEDGGAIGESGSGTKDSGGDCPSASSNGKLLDADCKIVVPRFKELFDEGKITSNDGSGGERTADIDKDLEQCSDERHVCHDGVSPWLLRAIIGIAENTGDEPVVLWNMNRPHRCDEFNHPLGLASDMLCNSPGTRKFPNSPSPEKCKRMNDYIEKNAEEIRISDWLWDNYKCEGIGNTPYTCRNDHNDHIHLGVKFKGGEGGDVNL